MDWLKDKLELFGYVSFGVIILATVVIGVIYLEILFERIIG